MSASPSVILADGKSTTVIAATVRDGDGSAVPNGTAVHFTTSAGTLDAESAITTSGVARVTLTSAPSPGKALITATSFSGAAGMSANTSIQVDFSANRDDVFTDGWMYFNCPQYLVYAAETKIVDAEGRNGSAELRFKSLRVHADSFQINLQTNLLLAKNVVIERDDHSVHAAELRYDLISGVGSAVIVGVAHQAAHVMTISGQGLDLSESNPATTTADDGTDPYRFTDISDSHTVVSARSIAVNPGVQLQFRRASIYSDGKKVLALPLHIMPMSGDELFGQQVAGITSQGFFLNVPYYFNVSPAGTGAIYIRNSTASTAGITTGTGLPITSTQVGRPGFAVDLEQIYSLGRGGRGTFLVDGLTRSGWSAHWNHNQKIDPITNGYFYVDYPQHRSLYASSGLNRQFKGLTWNVSANASNDPNYNGYSASSAVLNTYLQTAARLIGQSGVNVVTNFSLQTGRRTLQVPGLPQQITPVSTQTLDFRFFTAPLHPDRKTQVTNSFTVGQTWDTNRRVGALTLASTLGLTRSMPGRGNLSANYTYTYDPLLGQLPTQTTAGSTLQSILGGSTQHHLSLSYSAAPNAKLSYGLFSAYSLPLGSLGISANLGYRVNNNWRLGFTLNQDQFRGLSYRSYEYYVSRQILGRDLVVYYSTQTKKFSFDFAGFSF